jgi:hypothetical protein
LNTPDLSGMKRTGDVKKYRVVSYRDEKYEDIT